MLDLQGYRDIRLIYKNEYINTYLGVKEDTEESVAIKLPSIFYPNAMDISKLKLECNLQQKVYKDTGIKISNIEKSGKHYLFTVENMGFLGLNHILEKDGFLSIGYFLDLSFRIVEIVNNLHRNGYVHGDINSSIFLTDEEFHNIYICDFSYAKKIKESTLDNSEQRVNFLHYAAPEQIGIINSHIDYRTDIYSLGTVFYQILTKELPIEGKEPMDLVHNHMTKNVISPSKIREDIPQTLSNIILKCLNKHPKERYQSINGLRKDLLKFKEGFIKGEAPEFILGIDDIPLNFEISEKDYGRERETIVLSDIFEEMKNGYSQTVFISGETGIGKTTLVNNFEKIKFENVYFLSSKYESIKLDIPYKPFVQVFEQLIQYLLSETEGEIHKWKELFLKKAGANAFLLAKYIPSLNIILGEHPPVEEDATIETRNKILTCLKDIIKTFYDMGKHIVMFIDNLHWIDKGSLIILESIVKASNLKGVLFIGVYSSDKNEKATLMDEINKWEKDGVILHHMTLEPFSLGDTTDLVMDTLYCDYDKGLKLSEILIERTSGNPYYLKEVLKDLYLKGLIWHDFDKGAWNWDINTIKGSAKKDNIVSVLVDRLDELPRDCRQFVKYASCIGTVFQKDIIFNLMEINQQEFNIALDKLIIAGIVLEEKDQGLKFSNDKIQLSFYDVIEEGEKKTIHFRIGNYLFAKYEEQKDNKMIFQLVYHLNLCSDDLIDEKDKFDLARLNLIAGQLTKSAMAFNSARKYFSMGVNLLTENTWEVDYDLAFDLYFGLYETSYLIGDFLKAESLFQILIKEVKSLEKRDAIYLIKIYIEFRLARQSEAMDIALEALKDYKLKIPKKVTKLRILYEYLLTKFYVKDKNIERALLAKENYYRKNQTSHEKIIEDMYMALATMAYTREPNLMVFLTLVNLRQNIKNNNFEEIPKGLILYCVINTNIEKNYKLAFELGKKALAISDKWNSLSDKGVIYYLFSSLIHHWGEYIDNNSEYFEKAIGYCLESGNHTYTSFSITHYIASLHVKGVSAEKLLEKIEEYFKYTTQINHLHFNQFLTTYRQFCLCLLDKTSNPTSFTDENINESEFLEEIMAGDGRARKIFDYNLCKMQVCFLMEEYEKALELANESQKHEGRALGVVTISEYYFYQCLTITALYDKFNIKEKIKYINILKKRLKRMKAWAGACPENYKHKYYLILAEYNKIKGNYEVATILYDKAITHASDNNFLQNQGIAYERAARFYEKISMKNNFKIYFSMAYWKYMIVGFNNKARKMEEENHWIYGFRDPFQNRSSLNAELERSSIVKTYQAISQEIILEELLKKILGILLQNAGANRVLLLLYKDERLLLEGEGEVKENMMEVNVLQSLEIDKYKNIPHSIIKFVERTKENIILSNAYEKSIFHNTPYVVNNKIKSILCLPIMHQSRIIGILYLENKLLEGVFTPNQVELLNILSSQLAISIVNAGLYSELQKLNYSLEEKVLERTLKLEEFQQKMTTTLVEKSILEERTRIAREIHDTVGHTLTSVNVQIEAGKRLINKDTSLALEKLNQSQEQVRLGLNSIRKSLHMLKSGKLSEEEAMPSLESFIQDTMKYTGINIEYDIDPIHSLTISRKSVLYRALQEGITNGIRHGNSNFFKFSLKQEDNQIVFNLKDNGNGVDNINLGFGLTSMKDRILEMNGKFDVSSKKGDGFTINIRIPSR